jgi:hypothetical protein
MPAIVDNVTALTFSSGVSQDDGWPVCRRVGVSLEFSARTGWNPVSSGEIASLRQSNFCSRHDYPMGRRSGTGCAYRRDLHSFLSQSQWIELMSAASVEARSLPSEL